MDKQEQIQQASSTFSNITQGMEDVRDLILGVEKLVPVKDGKLWLEGDQRIYIVSSCGCEVRIQITVLF